MYGLATTLHKHAVKFQYKSVRRLNGPVPALCWARSVDLGPFSVFVVYLTMPSVSEDV
jgi:hypothetical protein